MLPKTVHHRGVHRGALHGPSVRLEVFAPMMTRNALPRSSSRAPSKWMPSASQSFRCNFSAQHTKWASIVSASRSRVRGLPPASPPDVRRCERVLFVFLYGHSWKSTAAASITNWSAPQKTLFGATPMHSAPRASYVRYVGCFVPLAFFRQRTAPSGPAHPKKCRRRGGCLTALDTKLGF